MKMQIAAIILASFLLISNIYCDRTIEVVLNPNCNECGKPDENGSYNNLVYVKAIGSNDTIHMMYSNIDSFTIMMFKTDLNTTVSINSTDLLSKNASQMYNSITFSKPPTESFGYAFPIIYEFNDTNGDADLTKVTANQTLSHLTSNLVWKPYKENSNTSGVFEGTYGGSNSNGSFKFVLRYLGKSLRDDELPRLLLNAESVSIDFVIDQINATFKDAKFALNVVFLSNYQQAKLDSKRTLDDEYTPATFRLWHVEVDDDQSLTHNYFQWRPIFYYNMPKNVENSTITRQYTLNTVKTDAQNEPSMYGIGSCFFESSKSFNSLNISFGIEGDEKNGYFYPQYNYSIWTFSIGMGSAPNEKMSSIVSLVIFVGFGLPALVIVIGLAVMIFKKLRRNSNYSEFQQL